MGNKPTYESILGKYDYMTDYEIIDTWTILHQAAYRGTLAEVKLLVEKYKSPYINAQTKEGYTPLMLSIIRKDRKDSIVDYLEPLSDPCLKTKKGWSACEMANAHIYLGRCRKEMSCPRLKL